MEEYLYSAFYILCISQRAQAWITQFYLQIHHACLSFVCVHQMAPPLTEVTESNCSLLLIYRPRRDERLSWPGWLTDSGRFTHISGHPSATGQAQDRESTPAEDRRSTTEPRNQLGWVTCTGSTPGGGTLFRCVTSQPRPTQPFILSGSIN